MALLLMRCLERAGDPAGAVRYATKHAELVRAELGLEPDPEVPRYAAELCGRAPEPAVPPRDSASPEPAAETTRARTGDAGGASSTTLGARIESGRPRGAPSAARNQRARASRWIASSLLAFAALAAVWWWPRTNLVASDALGSLVVLPFTDLGGDGDAEPLADGIAEELILRLSNVEDLRVIGRTSAFAFKGRLLDAREIGRRLGVAAVLDGSVRRGGDRLRIHAQLVDAANGFELWSETYERRIADVFAIQDEIAQAIIARLGVASAAPPNPGPVEDLEAYQRYLNGRFQWHARSEASLFEAVAHFESALARAPDYARAHAGLGDALAVLGFYDYLAPDDAFPRARAAAQRAIELDPSLAEPYATLGYVALYYDWDAAAAEGWLQRAIERSPGYSTAHQWYANLLTAQGRFAEAELEIRLATELDPLSLIANTALGWVHYYAGDYPAALNQLRQSLQLDSEFELAYLFTGLTWEAMGESEASLESIGKAVSLSGSAIARAALARGHALAGDVDGARALLSDLEREAETGYAPAFEIAKIHEALGDAKGTFAWLERAYEQRSHSMVFLAHDPQLRALRGQPRFQEWVRRVGVAGR